MADCVGYGVDAGDGEFELAPALQRLASAVTVGPQWGMSWVYDGFGNRTAQNVVKGSVPVQSISVDMNTNRITAWGYDANGNATSIPGVGTITYDASNRVKTVGSETYEYDPSNKRIWKNDTYTFWGARGERVGTYSVQLMQYLPEGQQTQVYQLSFVKGTEDWYFGGRRLQVTDRLGSVGGNNYYPYGEERSATANPADKFATYHRDGTGLDYADQRYYHAGSGRFISSDPYGGSGGPSDPGSWNRYAYVEGDPVNYVDPSGLIRCGDLAVEGGTLNGAVMENSEFGRFVRFTWHEGGNLSQARGSVDQWDYSFGLVAQSIVNRNDIANGNIAVQNANGTFFFRGGIYANVPILIGNRLTWSRITIALPSSNLGYDGGPGTRPDSISETIVRAAAGTTVVDGSGELVDRRSELLRSLGAEQGDINRPSAGRIAVSTPGGSIWVTPDCYGVIAAWQITGDIYFRRGTYNSAGFLPTSWNSAPRPINPDPGNLVFLGSASTNGFFGFRSWFRVGGGI